MKPDQTSSPNDGHRRALARRTVGAWVALGMLLLFTAPARALEFSADGVALRGVPFDLQLELPEDSIPGQLVEVRSDGNLVGSFQLGPGSHEVEIDAELATGPRQLQARAGDETASVSVRILPGWLSILPPILAILLALLTKNVLVALFCGIFAGALFLNGWNPLLAFARTIDQFIVPALADADHASIIVFSAFLGGMVAVISKSGGTQGIVEWLRPYADNTRRGQLATLALGILIFFDDYANTLIVGSTMRPVTDRLKISREKLAYIVDSTAAPVVTLVPISTWIGFEVGLVDAAFKQIGLEFNAYTTVVESIAFRFYPILTLVMVFTVSWMGRDFGPMVRAEARARQKGQLLGSGDTPLASYDDGAMTPPEGAPLRVINAALPIATVILVTLAGLLSTGMAASAPRDSFATAMEWIGTVFSNGASFKSLLWGSLAGLIVAITLACAQRILSLREAVESAVEGFKSLLLAISVLLLAWSIGAVCEQLHTADYLVDIASGMLSPRFVPVLIFLVAAAVAFATGTSWGTMGILTPLAIPVLHGLAIEAGFTVGSADYKVLLLGAISSVLAGSVWGDHCSPISDTTILSSMATGSDHIAHVKTQMPYALIVGSFGMLLGDIPTAFGLPPWVSILVGACIIVGMLRLFGKHPEEIKI